jgi:hypothetical protein
MNEYHKTFPTIPQRVLLQLGKIGSSVHMTVAELAVAEIRLLTKIIPTLPPGHQQQIALTRLEILGNRARMNREQIVRRTKP